MDIPWFSKEQMIIIKKSGEKQNVAFILYALKTICQYHLVAPWKKI